ncbi:MAG: hypothetical protein M5R40_25270 [Anaerolineae bacterium]|nr:hypothetical protein [Anaerolineae bacterium]
MRAGYTSHHTHNAKSTRPVALRLMQWAGHLAALALMWPMLIVCAIAVKLDSEGPVLVYTDGPQFRTITANGQVTRLGRFMRKAGFDRLPAMLAL